MHALNQRRRNDVVALGRALLDQELQHAHRCRFADVDERRRRDFAAAVGKDSFEECLAEIGNGRHPARLAAWQLMDADFALQPPVWRSWLLRINAPKRAPLLVDGSEGMALSFGKCCHPIPGDRIVGRLTANRGLAVHAADCRSWKREKRGGEAIPLRWSDSMVKPERDFETVVRVEMETDRNAMTTLADCALRLDAVLEQLRQIDRNQRMCVVVLRMRVKNRVHLARVIRGMRAIKAVSKVMRARG